MSDISATLTPAQSPASQPPPPLLKLRPPKGWAAINLREIWHFRDLLATLASRDLKLRYKQTALGIIWVILQPFLASVVFTLVFGLIAKMPSDGVPYFVFSYVAMLAWNLFSSVLTRSSACLTGNSNLISKVFFPRLVLPLSTVGSVLVDFTVGATMLLILLPVFHIPVTWAILLIPLWMAALLMVALGVGLVASALTVSYRDVQYILPVMMNILLYASPVAYSASVASVRLAHWPWLQYAYFLNPLANLVPAFSWSVLGGSGNVLAPDMGMLVYSFGFAAALLWVGAGVFKQMERKFADVI
jgi:homopolymeric O-antigen transport system permease protein